MLRKEEINIMNNTKNNVDSTFPKTQKKQRLCEEP